MARRNHTLEERVQAVKEYLEARKGFPELSEKYGTTAQVVRSWVKRYREMGVAGLEDRRGKRLASQTPRTTEEALRIEKGRLERENYLLRMELDLLKKCRSWRGGITEAVPSGAAVSSGALGRRGTRVSRGGSVPCAAYLPGRLLPVALREGRRP